jgi:hypothetical protein
MARRVLTDEIWFQLLAVMESKGCYDSKNAREVMEAIIWKLRVGGPWRDIPKEFCPWQTAFDRFNRWAKKGLWTNFFSAYEAKLIRSGYSPTEATSALTSMQVELGLGKSEPLDNLAEDLQPRSTWSVMRMETRSILKSLGVELMTLKQPPKLFVKSARPKTSSPTKATTRKASAKKRAARE